MELVKIFHGEQMDVESRYNDWAIEKGDGIKIESRLLAASNTPGCIIYSVSYTSTRKHKV